MRRHRLSKHLLRWICGGLAYVGLELLWRGRTHWTMGLLAAYLCVPLDIANEHIPWGMPLPLQAILGGLTATGAELCAGLVLNVWLGLGVWDYSNLPFNFMGQICPQFAALWCLISLGMIPLFDWLEYWLCGGERPHYKLY